MYDFEIDELNCSFCTMTASTPVKVNGTSLSFMIQYKAVHTSKGCVCVCVLGAKSCVYMTYITVKFLAICKSDVRTHLKR